MAIHIQPLSGLGPLLTRHERIRFPGFNPDRGLNVNSPRWNLGKLFHDHSLNASSPQFEKGDTDHTPAIEQQYIVEKQVELFKSKDNI